MRQILTKVDTMRIPMAAFRLSKWYLDCITDSGDASILYSGSASWGPLRLNYSSAIESSGALISTRHSLRLPPEPGPWQDKLRWNSEALGVDGEWEAGGRELRATVFASEEGAIEWHCIVPRGKARVGSRHGLGYVEHLDMTVSPWALPIRTLRWGRFTSETDSVVWIEWRGDDFRTMAWRNGSLALVRSFDDGQIDFEDGTQLLLDRSLVIRDGPLGTTALSGIPGLRDSVPGRLLQVVECKWRSRGQLQQPGANPIDGWAIHERVEWPR